MTTRRRLFRFIQVELECGHTSEINTSRYRVGQATRGILLGHAVRSGLWCKTCNAKCQPIRVTGMVSRP